MNRTQRSQLLREVFYAKFPHKAFPVTPPKPRRVEQPPKGWVRIEATFPPSDRSWDVRALFLKEPNEKPVVEVRTLRKERVSALTKISEELPIKLKRLL